MDNAVIPKDIMPTLVVGLGGTGFQVIKRLKKLFEKRYGKKRLPIRYLIIDTDLKSFLDDDIDNNEKCQLRFNEGVKATLDWAYNNPSFDWLPRNPKITPDFFTSTDQGAGLMRPIGRMYLCKNSKLVYDTLTAAKNDLVDLYKIITDVGEDYLENIDRHKVYIVGSLAGGTGCGTFLDVSVMLSKIFNRDSTNIIGMFTLESCYDDKLSSDLDAQNRSKANCYAALKELEFYMTSIEKSDDERYLFKYNNIGDIKLDKKLLDICYLIENKNEIGGMLTNIDDIYDLCSLQLFQEVGTKLGSQLRADYANFICKDKDPVLNRDRHFSTFSSSSMEVPIESLKDYCRCRLAKDILENISKNHEEIVIEDESRELLEKMGDELAVNDILEDFTKNNKISSKQYEAVRNKIPNLAKVDGIVEERYRIWNEGKSECKEKISSYIRVYINENVIKYGLESLSQILKRVMTIGNQEYREYKSEEPVNRERIKKSIEEISDKKVIKGKKEVSDSVVSSFNNYIKIKHENLCNSILKQKANVVNEVINEELEKIDIVKGKINKTNHSIVEKIKKINNQAGKKYGGNIISREMISKDFYEEYYFEKHGSKLSENIRAMFENKNILQILKLDNQELINICNNEVEEFDSQINIIDIMSRNSAFKQVSLDEYVKNEIEVTAKLAKPFWSAIKNPEVSWTECYYIGAIKDDNITNGFTIKPHVPIDTWIRSQTGERSRQARYVETTNPYAIDVIHITMGACAGYLPDIKNYRQYYLKLLATQAYPLHLSQGYIGLDELDYEYQELFEIYTLAHAYGAILNVFDSYIINISIDNGDYKYIYNAKSCLGSLEEKMPRRRDLPDNKFSINEKLLLGRNEKEVLDKIVEDKNLMELLKRFINYVEGKFRKEDLKNHKRQYVVLNETNMNQSTNNNIGKNIDFIAHEKLKFEIEFK